jgi:hypothetical protein
MIVARTSNGQEGQDTAVGRSGDSTHTSVIVDGGLGPIFVTGSSQLAANARGLAKSRYVSTHLHFHDYAG